MQGILWYLHVNYRNDLSAAEHEQYWYCFLVEKPDGKKYCSYRWRDKPKVPSTAMTVWNKESWTLITPKISSSTRKKQLQIRENRKKVSTKNSFLNFFDNSSLKWNYSTLHRGNLWKISKCVGYLITRASQSFYSTSRLQWMSLATPSQWHFLHGTSRQNSLYHWHQFVKQTDLVAELIL